MSNSKKRIAQIVTVIVVLGPLATWAIFSDDDPPLSAIVTSTHQFDDLNRLTHVARDGGDSAAYSYDAAGDITAVSTVGRSSVTLQGVLSYDDNHQDFEFCGTLGEAVTVRLEAIPREAGVGKFAEIRLEDKRVLAALPTVLTMVLPETDDFEIRVEDPDDDDDGVSSAHRYAGPFSLTLEASAATVATFVSDEDDDDDDDDENEPYDD